MTKVSVRAEARSWRGGVSGRYHASFSWAGDGLLRHLRRSKSLGLLGLTSLILKPLLKRILGFLGLDRSREPELRLRLQLHKSILSEPVGGG